MYRMLIFDSFNSKIQNNVFNYSLIAALMLNLIKTILANQCMHKEH